MPGVEDGDGYRTTLQTGAVGTIDVGVMHAAVLVVGRDPDRELAPRFDAGGGDRVRVDPRQDGVGRAGGPVAGPQERADGGVPTARDDVERSGMSGAGGFDHKAGEIPGVDVLKLQVRGAGAQDLTSPSHARKPPRQPPHVLIGTEDRSGASEQRPVGKDLLHRDLGATLEFGIFTVLGCGVAATVSVDSGAPRGGAGVYTDSLEM